MATNDNNTAAIKNAEENIKSRQKKIATKKFYCDIAFKLNNEKVGLGQTTVDVTLDNFADILSWQTLYSLNRGSEWWFCFLNCTHKDTLTLWNAAEGGSIRGETNEVNKLIQNHAHYILRVYLTDLKLNPDPNLRRQIICKIDRYEIRETGDDDWKPKNYVVPADSNSSDVVETDTELPLTTEFKRVQVTIAGETFEAIKLASAPGKDSPLVQIGLKKGDVITHLNGNPINELTPEVLEKTRGKIKVRYIKDGRQVVEGTIDIP
jgi:hypothetical protein